MYAGGTGERIDVLCIDFEADAPQIEHLAYYIDRNEHQVVARRNELPVVARMSDGLVVSWNGGDRRITHINKAQIDEKGRERDLVRVFGFSDDESGFAFIRYDDEVDDCIEALEYDAHVEWRVRQGLPLGRHLEQRFQRLYYAIGETEYVLSLITGSLSETQKSLWNKYRVEPFGAVYVSRREYDIDGDRVTANDELPVTVVPRDSDNVIFYNQGQPEDFRTGRLTDDTDASDDRVICDVDFTGTEVDDLRLALDKEWNPDLYET